MGVGWGRRVGDSGIEDGLGQGGQIDGRARRVVGVVGGIGGIRSDIVVVGVVAAAPVAVAVVG